MKISVERESLESLLRTLCRAENAMVYSDAIGGIQDSIQELTAILEANPVRNDGIDWPEREVITRYLEAPNGDWIPIEETHEDKNTQAILWILGMLIEYGFSNYTLGKLTFARADLGKAASELRAEIEDRASGGCFNRTRTNESGCKQNAHRTDSGQKIALDSAPISRGYRAV